MLKSDHYLTENTNKKIKNTCRSLKLKKVAGKLKSDQNNDCNTSALNCVE